MLLTTFSICLKYIFFTKNNFEFIAMMAVVFRCNLGSILSEVYYSTTIYKHENNGHIRQTPFKHDSFQTDRLCAVFMRRSVNQAFLVFLSCLVTMIVRRLWQHVTAALKAGDIDAATEHKHQLEEKQRREGKQRTASSTTWKPKYFIKEVRLSNPTLNSILYEDLLSQSLHLCIKVLFFFFF